MATTANPPVTCRECGQTDDANYMDPTRREMIAAQLCFTCHFWTDWVKRRDDANVARIGGLHYYIGPENAGPAQSRGFAGARSVIRFANGREVVTTNLWHQGEIPAHFRGRLPDNAQFVTRG